MSEFSKKMHIFKEISLIRNCSVTFYIYNIIVYLLYIYNKYIIMLEYLYIILLGYLYIYQNQFVIL